MSFNVLVAEPSNSDWNSIAKGVRHSLPGASILRVKDGEQAIRFLFQRGLLTDDPQIPNLVLLAAELPVVSAERVFARLRQDPRTSTAAVIVLCREHGKAEVDPPDAFGNRERLLRLRVDDAVETQVAEAVHRLCSRAYGPRRERLS